MSEQFITHEVGSLAKPEWRVKAINGGRLTAKDIVDATLWGDRLGINPAPLVEVLSGGLQLQLGQKLSLSERKFVRDQAALFATCLQEEAGLDVVYDGEQDRVEMYEHAIKNSNGFEFRGTVRAFDNRYYDKAAVVDVPSLPKPWHDEELKRLQKITDKQIKVPITGAYTLGDWSYDEFYGSDGGLLRTHKDKQQANAARERLILDIARNLLRPNIESLIQNGATWIQIDEPAATTKPHEVPLFVKSFNESIKGLKNAEFSVHICFSDYSLLFPHIQEMENCAQYSLEFANKDSKKLGIQDEDRPGYNVLKLFNEYNVPGRIGLGVTDIHSDFDEPVELVRDRILYASRILGAERINPSPDCGLRTRTWEVAFNKMKKTVDGAKQAEIRLQ